MALRIALNNPVFTLKEKVQELSNDFLKNFGFNYFQYLRCYADGSIGLLTNNTGLIEYVQQIDNLPVVYSSYAKEYENTHSYWFLWDDSLPKFPVQLAREKFNFHNGITMVRRSQHYYDMIAVALPTEHPNAASFYLNKLKIIEQYINDFERNHRDLITMMNKNKIALPNVYRDTNYEMLCLANGRVNVYGKYGMTYITSQELACLRILFQDASYKEIAQCLGLSPRTVETYISRVRQRTGFKTGFEIDRALSLCPYLSLTT